MKTMIHVLLMFVVLALYESYTQNLVSAAENVSAGKDIVAFHSISTQCLQDHFTILLSTKLIPNVDDAIFHLNNKRCNKSYQNSSHILFSLKPSECGTITETYSNGLVIYTSLVTVLFKEHEGLKNSTKVLKVQCMFNATTNISRPLPRQDVANSTNVKVLEGGNMEHRSKNGTVQSSVEIQTKNDQSSDSKSVNHHNATKGEPEGRTETLQLQSSMEKIRKETALLLDGRNATVAEGAQTENSVALVESLQDRTNSSRANESSVSHALGNSESTTANVTESQKLDYRNVTFTADQRTSTVVRNGDKMTFQVKLNPLSGGEKKFNLAINDCYTSPHAEKKEGKKDALTFIKSGCEIEPRFINFVFKRRSPSQKFSFKIVKSHFKTIKTLFIHCSFVVCGGHDLRSPCGMGCRGTRKLIEFEKDALIHSVVGPFTMENKDEESGLPVVSTVLILLLVCVSVIVIFCIYCRRRKHKGSDRLLENEHVPPGSEVNPGLQCSTIPEDETVESLESPHGNDNDAILGGRKRFLNMDRTKV